MEKSSLTPQRSDLTVLPQMTTTTETSHSALGSQQPVTHLLEVANLSKSFGELKAVDDVSFHVDGGEVFGLLGPNGAGKSTTMMMLCGLLVPDAGAVRIEGTVLTANNLELRAVMGVVPQELAIYPELSARENLNFFGRLYGLKGSDLGERIDGALKLTGLQERADDPVDHFSGGMKRRLNFGIALLHQPRLLILDEPTVGVDPQSRSHLLDCIRRLNKEGVAVIYASHYMEEVQEICDRVAILDHGKLIASGIVSALLARMKSELLLRIAEPTEKVRREIELLAKVRGEAGDDVATIVVSHNQHAEEETLNATLTRILQLLEGAGVRLHAVETHEPNLERLFLEMTGKRLRD